MIGPDEVVYLDPAVTQKFDYEAELGVVIGTGGKNIPEEKALDAIFGFTIINDLTARDLQRHHDQWFKGKSLDRSCPMGPCIVHRSAITDPQNLGIELTVAHWRFGHRREYRRYHRDRDQFSTEHRRPHPCRGQRHCERPGNH